MVSKGEEQEQNLYGKVRNAEYSRQKQEQSVRRLQQQLNQVKKKNASTVKQEMSNRNKQEMELEQLLVREKAELDKVGQRFLFVNTRNLLSRSLCWLERRLCLIR